MAFTEVAIIKKKKKLAYLQDSFPTFEYKQVISLSGG